MEDKLLHELNEILKTKPPTPICRDDQYYGKCLVWTKETGWYVA